MKGVVLAGGTGSRMFPLTKVTNKHLLPVYNKPMIFYPIDTLKKMGIREILIVSGKEHAGHIMGLLGSGWEYGLKFTYRVQDRAGGIAQAMSLAENFVGDDSVAVILGDNIFSDTFDISEFREGSITFLKEVPDPYRFGVAEIKEGKIISIEEKPRSPKSNFAVTGLYIYDKAAFNYIKQIRPSQRGELEQTDVNNKYIAEGKMSYRMVNGFWSDAGTFESLFNATKFIKGSISEVGLDLENEKII